MASYCHHHHHCQNPIPNPTTCNWCCNNPPPHSPPPQPQPQPQIPLDSLLQALSFHLQNQPQHHQPHPHPTKPHLPKTPFRPNTLNYPRFKDSSHLVISSLLQRINNLESALHHFFPSSSPPNKFSPPCSYLREAAARVIQTHFRAFLVRRSRTLRQLKELAFVKSSFNSLKSAVSNKSHLDFKVVSRKAMDLLLRVDSIEGGDTMIKDGKRSITRELVRFLDCIDGFNVKRNGVEYVRNLEKSRAMSGRGNLGVNWKENVLRARKFCRFSGAHGNDENGAEFECFRQFVGHQDDEDNDGSLRTRKGILVKGVVQPRVKKSVMFVENGNVPRVFDDVCEPVFEGKFSYNDGSDLSDDHEQAIENQFDIVEESRGVSKGKGDDVEAESESEGSGESSYGERIPKRDVRSNNSSSGNGSSRYFQDQDGSLVFSAPVPAKMEPRTNLTKKRQSVKINA